MSCALGLWLLLNTYSLIYVLRQSTSRWESWGCSPLRHRSICLKPVLQILATESVVCGPTASTTLRSYLRMNLRPHSWPIRPESSFYQNARQFLCFLGQCLGPLCHISSTKEGVLQSHFLYWKCFSTDLVRHQRQSFSSLEKRWFDCLGRRTVWQHIRVQCCCMCWHRPFLAFLSWTWELTCNHCPEVN